MADTGPMGYRRAVGSDRTSGVLDRERTMPARSGESGDAADNGPAGYGRYVILGRLGAGGMGIVYKAFDPELDRVVALKVLRPGQALAGSQDRSRLLREAQAMAQLNDPNVVAVHDVGLVDREVYVAMEFVPGQTLSQWLEASLRPWRDILRVFTAAGRGLAAAHAKDLIHRDFKPDNVMLGDDGRVRVMDFGLVRTDPVEPASDSDVTPAPTFDALASEITQTGGIMGTPAYMAPEQFVGGPTDVRTDVFAFCVALWEALYGERPFEGDTIPALVAAVGTGTIRSPPPGRGVPGWIRNLVARGLRPRPQDRWASMDELLGALGLNPTAKRRAWIGGVTVLVVATVAWGVHVRGQHRTRARCEAAGAQLAEVWNPQAAGRLRDSFLASEVGYAQSAYTKSAQRFDVWSAGWASARTRACIMSEVDGTWSSASYSAARDCLEERGLALRSTVEQLSSPDAEAVARAVSAAAALPSVDPCLDEHWLELRPALPDDGATRERIGAVRQSLAEADALGVFGRYEDGLAVARGAAEEAVDIGWRPLVTDARLRVGLLLEGVGQYEAAGDELVDTYLSAAELGDARPMLVSATAISALMAGALGRSDDGLLWSRFAEVALKQQPDPSGVLRAELATTVAICLHARGDYDDAEAELWAALDLRREALGEDHPQVAEGLANLGAILYAQGKIDSALTVQRDALQRFRAAFGTEHPHVATGQANLAAMLAEQRRFDEAETAYREALELRVRSLGPGHPDSIATRAALATALQSLGRLEEAEGLLRQSLSDRRRLFGTDHPTVARTRNNLGLVLANRGLWEQAEAEHRAALVGFERAFGPGHPHLVIALLGLGKALVNEGRPTEARATLERAWEIGQNNPVSPAAKAQVSWHLARVLPADQHGRARELAQFARETFDSQGRSDLVGEVDAWMASAPLHGPPQAPPPDPGHPAHDYSTSEK